ncbi:hypothetical protein MNB_SV-9-742 [hydrothermal vent metagenome]|uniref:Uncharacterized protein n=1 Tax=hydrothermal vent metagenome TaxID=652676 RepID=A0A1W1C0S9_9ZZZZ
MRLQRTKLNSLINFLLGVSWALVFISFIATVISYYKFSIVMALVLAFFASLPSLFLVVILEHILSEESKLDEMKRQTKILEDIQSQNSQKETILDKI